MPPPVSIQLGSFQLIEFDSSARFNRRSITEQLRNYARSSLAARARTPGWWIIIRSGR